MVCNFYAMEEDWRDRMEGGGEFCICIGRILSQMMRFDLALETGQWTHWTTVLVWQYVDVACLSSDISVAPMPVNTIPELFSRAFWVLPETRHRIGRPETHLAEDSGGRSIHPLNFGLASARRRALNRSTWQLYTRDGYVYVAWSWVRERERERKRLSPKMTFSNGT